MTIPTAELVAVEVEDPRQLITDMQHLLVDHRDYTADLSAHYKFCLDDAEAIQLNARTAAMVVRINAFNDVAGEVVALAVKVGKGKKLTAAPDLADALLADLELLLNLAQEMPGSDLLGRVNAAIARDQAVLRKAGAL